MMGLCMLLDLRSWCAARVDQSSLFKVACVAWAASGAVSCGGGDTTEKAAPSSAAQGATSSASGGGTSSVSSTSSEGTGGTAKPPEHRAFGFIAPAVDVMKGKTYTLTFELGAPHGASMSSTKYRLEGQLLQNDAM